MDITHCGPGRVTAMFALALAVIGPKAVAAPPAGLALQFVYDGDLWSNLSGGQRTGEVYAAHLDMSLTADANTLFGWTGTKFYWRGFADSGASISRLVGDVQGVNNWESGYRAGKLLEAWVDHVWIDSGTSLRFGLYDTATEFDKNKSQVLFLNGSQGMNRPLSLSGQNGPSTYPATSLGLRLRHEFNQHWNVKAAVLDGVPDDPAVPQATVVAISPRDGALMIGELRYHDPSGHRMAAGYWRYTADFIRLETPAAAFSNRDDGNQGFYLSGDLMLTSTPGDPLRGISTGLRLAHAEDRFNPYTWFASGVVTDIGFSRGRPEDKLGFGFAYSRTGEAFRRGQFAQHQPVRSGELTLEATYRAPVTSWISLQPDLQYVIHPANAPTRSSALVIGLRMELTFAAGEL